MRQAMLQVKKNNTLAELLSPTISGGGKGPKINNSVPKRMSKRELILAADRKEHYNKIKMQQKVAGLENASNSSFIAEDVTVEESHIVSGGSSND